MNYTERAREILQGLNSFISESVTDKEYEEDLFTIRRLVEGALSPEQKLANVEAQYNFLQRQVAFISCPYCGAVSIDGTIVDCCRQLGEAIAAVLHRKIMEAQTEQADRIAQNTQLTQNVSVN